MNQIQTIHRAYDVGVSQRIAVCQGMTVEEIAVSTHGDTNGLVAHIRAPVGHPVEWIELDRSQWRRIKPKTDDCLLFGYRLQGGDTLRNIFTIVATVLIAVIAPYLIPALGTFGAALATAALSIGAKLAINALFPASSSDVAALTSSASAEERARQFARVDSDSNVLAKDAYLPTVAGTRRITPPELASPLFYLDNGVQTIRRAFGLDGHHLITDIQVDRAPIADFASITTEIKDGAETTDVATFVDKISKFTSISETLSTFSVDGNNLVDQETPFNSEPRWVRFVTAFDSKLEEISVRWQVDSFIKSDDGAQNIRVPARIRFRPKGSAGAWFNLPEIHLVGRDVSTSLKEIRIRWDDQFGAADTSGDISFEFFQRVPPADYTLSDESTGDQWQADAHFVSGSGLQDTQNIQGKRNGLRIQLNEDDYPKQEYEFEIIRGCALNSGAISGSTYAIGGNVKSLFVANYTSSKWQVAVSQGGFVGRVTAAHVTSIVDRPPCQQPETAIIGLESRGQTVKNVTALSSGYVLDWDGSGWNDLVTTKNPATHYRKYLAEFLNHNGVSLDLISNASFVAWRQECIARGYEVSAVFAGATTTQVLAKIATAGFAAPSFSDGYGIDFFKDRSSDRPETTFSPRNASISVEWAFDEKPVGIRATFQNEAKDYADDEMQVNNPIYANYPGDQKKVYDMIANPDLVERRVFFDILQANHQRRRAWIVNTSIEGFACERGQLVGLVTDLTSDTNSGARIRKVIDSTNFTIDQEIPAESTEVIYDETNIFNIDNIFDTGAQSVCLVTTPTGTEMRTIVAAEQTEDGNVIRVDEAFSSTDLDGAHIVLGPASDFMHRCIVAEVDRKHEENSRLILVDEAPQIFDAMQERFPGIY